jgi:N-acetylmuramoyl-L-alanine amidase CwlA
MEIKIKPCNPANYGGSMAQAKYIVIHWTSNQGDTAKNNVDYFAREVVKASAHYFVDETEIWNSVPVDRIAYHVGAKTYKHPTCRNSNSIGIEICMTGKGYVLRRGSIERAAILTRMLMDKYGIPIERVIRHHDVTGKDCPAPMVTSPVMWAEFKKSLEEPELTEQQVRAIAREETKNYLASLEKLPASDWAKEELAKAKANGITDGTAPQAYATREQVAVMIQRTK